MRKLLSTAVTVAGLVAATVLPTSAHEGHAHNLPIVEGKITKIDASAGTVTIQHAAIPNLKMGAMTMVFKAADPAMLGRVKAGDAVNFSADKVNGQLTVTDIGKK